MEHSLEAMLVVLRFGHSAVAIWRRRVGHDGSARISPIVNIGIASVPAKGLMRSARIRSTIGAK